MDRGKGRYNAQQRLLPVGEPAGVLLASVAYNLLGLLGQVFIVIHEGGCKAGGQCSTLVFSDRLPDVLERWGCLCPTKLLKALSGRDQTSRPDELFDQLVSLLNCFGDEK